MYCHSAFGFGDNINEALMFARMNHLMKNKTGDSSIVDFKDVYEIKVPENTDHSEFHLKMIFAMGCHGVRKIRIPTISEKKGYDYVKNMVGPYAMTHIIDSVFEKPQKCVGFRVYQHNFNIEPKYRNTNIYRFIF